MKVSHEENRIRKQKMMKLRLDGMTYRQIGDKFGVSRQRVQDLLAPPAAIRRLVIKRDEGKCQECGILTGAGGDIHHDNGNGEDYNNIEKLRLLCHSCHRRIHCRDYVAPPFSGYCSECGTKMSKGGGAHTGLRKGENIKWYQNYRCPKCGHRMMNWHEPYQKK